MVHFTGIASPVDLHDAHIRFSLREGADAICEKPVVLNPWNVEALQKLEYHKNLLFPSELGNYPDATAVFDVDAIGLTNIITRLNHGLDLAGNPIGEPTAFHVGVGVNPGAINPDDELRRLDWKIRAGAEFMITQPVFDWGLLERFIRRVEPLRLPLLCGIWPLVSYRNAEFMNNEVPGAQVPTEILERMRRTTTQEEGFREGVAIAKETYDRTSPACSSPPPWAASRASSRFWNKRPPFSSHLTEV